MPTPTATTNDVRFLAPHENAPETLVAEVEIPITEGLLQGMTITGIQVWRRKEDGGLFVSFPGRLYQTKKGDTRQWDYVRAGDGSGRLANATKERVRAAYKAAQAENDGKDARDTK